MELKWDNQITIFVCTLFGTVTSIRSIKRSNITDCGDEFNGTLEELPIGHFDIKSKDLSHCLALDCWYISNHFHRFWRWIRKISPSRFRLPIEPTRNQLWLLRRLERILKYQATRYEWLILDQTCLEIVRLRSMVADFPFHYLQFHTESSSFNNTISKISRLSSVGPASHDFWSHSLILACFFEIKIELIFRTPQSIIIEETLLQMGEALAVAMFHWELPRKTLGWP